jgi:hypothetical protein
VTHRQAVAAGRAVELRHIHRAHEERERQAWDDLRDGRIEEALTWMAEHDRIRIYDTRPQMLEGIVDAWWAGNRDGLMVTDTSNAERDSLNELAQARRLEAGELGGQAVALANGRQLRVGDQVLFNTIHRPGQRGVRRVENGTAAQVVGVDVDQGSVELELAEPSRQPRRLVLGADAPLDLAYARHVVKAQGVTAEDTDLGVSRHTAHNELYVMGTRARNGARVHSLAAELADGLEMTPEELKAALAPPRSSEAGGLPPGATPVADVLAAFEAERERREREETIRLVSSRAGRSSTKEAVADRKTTDPSAERAGQHATSDIRDEWVAARDAGREHDAERDWQRSPSASRRQAPRGSERPVHPIGARRPRELPPQAFPARDPWEGMARHQIETYNSVRGLAYYRVGGRLHEAADPAVRAAELLAGDSEAIVVVPDEVQEHRLREALGRLIAVQRDHEASDPWSGRIVQASPAYDDRVQRRARWLQQLEQHQQRTAHLPEPGAVPRAYVVATEPWASPALTRGLSVAAESHLVVPTLRSGMAEQVETEAADIKAAQAARADERARGRAERAREHAYGRYATVEERGAVRDRERER